MKNVAFITAFSSKTIHPRVATEAAILKEIGYNVTVLSYNDKPKGFYKLYNLFWFYYFKKHIYKHIYPQLKKFDIIVIYDFSLLPLINCIDTAKTKTIYETIDNNVFLVFYELSEQLKFIKPLKKLVTKHYAKVEKKLAAKADSIIVNSKALQNYFSPLPTTLNVYTSPFENLYKKTNLSANNNAFLYLGIFKKDKGAHEVIELTKKHNTKLFVFGDIKEKDILESVKSNPLISWVPRINPSDLLIELEKLQKQYRLFGLSIVLPIHESYATQEANKDQDYLALGFPIIGNDRLPTLEKINSGCGVLYTDTANVNEILTNPVLYNNISDTCRSYYLKNYSYSIFKENLKNIFNSLS